MTIRLSRELARLLPAVLFIPLLDTLGSNSKLTRSGDPIPTTGKVGRFQTRLGTCAALPFLAPAHDMGTVFEIGA